MQSNIYGPSIKKNMWAGLFIVLRLRDGRARYNPDASAWPASAFSLFVCDRASVHFWDVGGRPKRRNARAINARSALLHCFTISSTWWCCVGASVLMNAQHIGQPMANASLHRACNANKQNEPSALCRVLFLCSLCRAPIVAITPTIPQRKLDNQVVLPFVSSVKTENRRNNSYDKYS